jgi:branched-chain amino acid transport system permease protein
MEYVLHLAILIAFYAAVAQSLNLSAGYAGLISLSQAGFFGIGAYTTAILSTRYGLSFWMNLPLAMCLSGLVAGGIALIVLRTVEDYFIISTLGVQVILYSLMNNLVPLTRGPMGITNIPPIRMAGMVFSSKIAFLSLTISFLGVTWWLLQNLAGSGFGRVLKAVREDEIFTASIGRDPYRAKVTAFTITAVLATIPGALYAHYISYVDPTGFTVTESIFILSIVIIGGMGSLRGSLLAAALLVLLPEGLRFIGIPFGIAANLRQMLYGGAMVVWGLRAKCHG